MSKISDVMTRMRKMPEVRLHRPATETEIKQTERMLSAKLPLDYREFVLACGWAVVGDNEIYGLGPDADKAIHVYENAANEHVMAEPCMHHNLVPVMNDGMGNHYCLDTDRVKDGACPVVFWQHDHPRGDAQRPRRVAGSFTEWLTTLLEELHGK